MALLVALPFVYFFNVLFFIPNGDQYLPWALLPAALGGLVLRRRAGDWSMHGLGPLLLPLLVYSTVLAVSHLTLGGFESTLKAFVVICLFLYLAGPRLRLPITLRFLPLVAAFQLVVLTAYQHHVTGLYRAPGFTNELFLGMFAFVIALLNLYLADTSRQRAIHHLHLLGALLAMYAVTLTQSRGVLIAIVPVALIYLWYGLRTAQMARAFSARLLIIICMVATMFLTPQVLQRFEEGIGNLRGDTSASVDSLAYQHSSVGFRLLMWRFSLESFKASPVWGLGRQGFEERRRGFVESGRVLQSRQALFLATHAHNQYLQELVMRGLIGLGALLWLWLGHLQAGRRLTRQSPWAGYAILSLVSAFMTFGLTEVALKHDEKIYTYLMSLAFLYQLASPARQIAVSKSPAVTPAPT